MAEAARRTRNGQGSDVVRRLIARPIRLHAAPAAQAAVTSASRPIAEEPEMAVNEPAEAASSDIKRLRAEMMLLKAVLHAERSENASLRACLGVDEADETLGAEARAVRDRWATLVDRLLHAPA
ncbi:hypothetical protein [Methylobacterium gnaphalii]|uniref:Uncharacterized protein n=1 Tax=Methylobacterium gnaphalii TaxID=1010610 RepID=A0A512JNN4_9HYPH|nr:hypothetical protein [Methylobacterium gnaphalii]GEP11559.1 hypothetical protein MGN01_34040 [Methylobacterium gnaphalii]GJD70300.1 hypothetical protein MMMDOFMJ_3245 [Methylobacterium gnaphalii]GLS48806.1 hypothetical protein GCM10007885_16510 [Methylobacterium gnaphalii]